ncbi:hypothetical protein [Streptomyces sp. NBC_00057]|uniref:hypothetical protein n=1 Tax=Streptomyces sp. NBC_00057 TaxID=2975634 RepID=UPI00324FA90F
MATTGVRFFRTLGSALGAAAFGTVLSRVYAAHGPGGTTSTIGRLTGRAHQQAMDAFVTSTNVVFWSATGVMLLATVPATRLPARREPDRADRADRADREDREDQQQPPAPVAAPVCALPVPPKGNACRLTGTPPPHRPNGIPRAVRIRTPIVHQQEMRMRLDGIPRAPDPPNLTERGRPRP